MVKLFKDDFDRTDFFDEISENFYSETQEGFNLLADDINELIDSRFRVSFEYQKESENLKIVVNYEHYLGGTEACYRTCMQHNNMYTDLSQIENILTAFACGLGFDC